MDKENTHDYDLIIAGAGPAGLCLARELSDSSLKILILDKKKNAEDVQYNTSGSFISPKEWNLPKDVLHPISKLNIYSKNEAATGDIEGFVIDRKKLLSFLESEAKRNTHLEIRYETIIESVNTENGGILSLKIKKGVEIEKVSAKIFADCSGISQILGKKLDLIKTQSRVALGIEYLVPLLKEDNAADLFLGRQLEGGYGWIFPKDSKTAIIGYGTLEKEKFKDIETSLQKMWQIEKVSEKCQLEILEKNTAVLRTGKFPGKLARGNLLIIGDSGLQANPLLGEGIRFVMDAARIAAPWIKRTIREKNNSLLRNYDKEWKKKYNLKYKLALRLQEKMKSKSANNKTLDCIIGTLNSLSTKDFKKIVKGDLTYSTLMRFAFKYIFS